MLSYPSGMSVSNRALTMLAEALRRERRVRRTGAVRRTAGKRFGDAGPRFGHRYARRGAYPPSRVELRSEQIGYRTKMFDTSVLPCRPDVVGEALGLVQLVPRGSGFAGGLES